MAPVINRELEAGYYSRIQALLIEIDRLVGDLEESGADPSEILDALIEYTELSEDYGYLR